MVLLLGYFEAADLYPNTGAEYNTYDEFFVQNLKIITFTVPIHTGCRKVPIVTLLA